MDKVKNKKQSYPVITFYCRLIDRVTKEPLTEYKQYFEEDVEWNLGTINKTHGGYSQYLLDMDIWNNEPALSGGFTRIIYDDAENCNIEILYKDKKYEDFNIIQIKNNNEKVSDFSVQNKLALKGVREGVLKGDGDHTKVLLGIKLNKDLDLSEDDKEINFKIRFNFESDNIQNNIDVNAYINIIDEIIPIKKEQQINTNNVLTGELSNNVGDTRIDVYNLDGFLQEHYIAKDNKFHLFLKSGIYNIIIRNDKTIRQMLNYKVDDGININYADVNSNALIVDINNNICRYLDLDDKGEICYTDVMYGVLKDNGNNVIQNAEILMIKDDQLMVYYVTDKNGKYKFIVEDTDYIMKIRKYNSHLVEYTINNNKPRKINNEFKIDY